MLIFKEQFSNVTFWLAKDCARFTLLVGSMVLRFPFFCRCYHSGISSWLREGAGSHGCGSLLPGCAWIRGSVSLGVPAAAQDSRAVCNILPDHTDPGMGIKLISKRQEKQPAGQPELSLPGSLQIILASTSLREKQVPYASVDWTPMFQDSPS